MKITAFILAFSGLSTAAISGTAGPIAAAKTWEGAATLSIGPDFINPGKTQTLALLPPFQNTYAHDSSPKTIADAGGFVGFERRFNEELSIQLGISGYVNAKMMSKGSIWQFTLPEFEVLSYGYHIQHNRAMAATKLLTTVFLPELHPYISGEIGAAFNRANGYQETALEAGVLPMAPFADQRTTSFAWGIGFGLDCNLSQHARLGVGYQFSDLGSVSLGQTTASLTTQTLHLSHLYANQLRAQLTILV